MQTWVNTLLNDYQRDFPLQPRPFAEISERLGTSETQLVERLQLLMDDGVVSRVGPVFKPNTVGVSTLAAMKVPAAKLDEIALLVSACPEVNHNYEREHAFNLWFVATAPSQVELDRVIQRIRLGSGYPVMLLPLIRDYHIDLGFNMSIPETGPQLQGELSADSDLRGSCAGESRCYSDLIAAIQSGLPLCDRPFHIIAEQLGSSENEVLAELKNLLDSGIIKRLGVIVRHHELGYRANAMVVWDVPDEEVDVLGDRLGAEAAVTLCYQRPRHQPDWRYNLFCMVHGKQRDAVIESIEGIVERNALQQLPREILFSARRFKQRGARYRNS